MRAFVAVMVRELRSLWGTALGWLLLTLFLLLQGATFYTITLHHAAEGAELSGSSPLSAYLGQDSLLLTMTLLLICPALTMRTFAEERKSGTMEVLLSSPLSAGALVLAKYAAVLLSYCIFWAPTLAYAMVLRESGPITWPVLFSGYLGIFLAGASSLGRGILMSAFAKNQIVALMLALSVELGLFVMGLGQFFLEPGPGAALSSYISLTTMQGELAQGMIDSRRIVFHLSTAGWALFVTTLLAISWRHEG
jgi:ABC-2 type transport system permease protein